jgi:hypothetical protein
MKKVTEGWEVPISRYDVENFNDRVYPKALWENVVNKQRHIWQGSPCLVDHPAEDSSGSPANICGVWLEARVANDGYVYGTLVPSGRLGEDLQDHLAKGLRAGTSSSGFGDLCKDGRTVDSNSYLIERLSDWVLTPSQGTYFTHESVTGKSQQTQNASDSRLGESAHKQESVGKEKESMKLSRLEEKKFRKDMEGFLNDARNIANPQDRLQEFEEILSYLQEGACPDLKDQITTHISEQRAEIARQLSDNKKLQEELGIKDVEDLKQKLTRLGEDTTLLKAESKDWQSIATVLQGKLEESRRELASRPTNAYTAHLKTKIDQLYAERSALAKAAETNASSLKESSSKAAASTKVALLLAEKTKETVAQQRTLIEGQTATIAELTQRLAEQKALVEQERQNFVAFKRKLREDAIPKVQSSPAEAISKFVGFREANQVDTYWADLLLRHGKDIMPFKERILSSKTYRDAQAIYMKIQPSLQESADITAMRLPESTAVSMKERGAMLEKVGVQVDATDFYDRLPTGWQ